MVWRVGCIWEDDLKIKFRDQRQRLDYEKLWIPLGVWIALILYRVRKARKSRQWCVRVLQS